MKPSCSKRWRLCTAVFLIVSSFATTGIKLKAYQDKLQEILKGSRCRMHRARWIAASRNLWSGYHRVCRRAWRFGAQVTSKMDYFFRRVDETTWSRSWTGEWEPTLERLQSWHLCQICSLPKENGEYAFFVPRINIPKVNQTLIYGASWYAFTCTTSVPIMPLRQW